jgi:hypothetical protein
LSREQLIDCATGQAEATFVTSPPQTGRLSSIFLLNLDARDESAFVVILFLSGTEKISRTSGDAVLAADPAAEIDIGATLGTERPIALLRRLAADRTAAAALAGGSFA